jgi:hypothetical protein
MEIEDFAAHANIGELARRTARIVEWEIQGKFTASQAFDEIRKVYLELKNSTEEIRGVTNV